VERSPDIQGLYSGERPWRSPVPAADNQEGQAHGHQFWSVITIRLGGRDLARKMRGARHVEDEREYLATTIAAKCPGTYLP
jgi:hypothetical protein